MNLLQRVGLIGYDEPLPPDENDPDADEFYHVAGVLPMLWQWVRDSIDFTVSGLAVLLAAQPNAGSLNGVTGNE